MLVQRREREGWNQSRAARRLGVRRNTLITRLAAWGFHRDGPEIASAPRPVAGNDSPGRG